MRAEHHDIAQGLVRAGDGSGFNDSSAFVGNVLDLVPEDDDADEEEESDHEEYTKSAKGGEKEKEEGETPKKRVPKKSEWFDKDRLRNNMRRDCKKIFDQTKANCQEAYAKLQKLLNDVPDKHRAEYDGEVRISQTFLKAMGLLLEGTDDQLKEYIQGFMHAAQSAESANKSSVSSSLCPTASLGSAPPCQGYEKLMIFSEWQISLEAIMDAESPAELKEKKRELFSGKAMYLAILKACKLAATDMDKMGKGLAEAAEADKGATAAASSAKSAKANDIWTVRFSDAQYVRVRRCLHNCNPAAQEGRVAARGLKW